MVRGLDVDPGLTAFYLSELGSGVLYAAAPI